MSADPKGEKRSPHMIGITGEVKRIAPGEETEALPENKNNKAVLPS